MTEDKDVQFGVDPDIIKQRARHDTLIEERIRTGKKSQRTVARAKRVASDAHLRIVLRRENLEKSFDAARHVMLAVASGMLSRSSDYTAGHSPSASSRDAALAHWIGWCRVIKQSGLDMGILEDIMLLGRSCNDVDRSHHTRYGHAIMVLIEALKLW